VGDLVSVIGRRENYVEMVKQGIVESIPRDMGRLLEESPAQTTYQTGYWLNLLEFDDKVRGISEIYLSFRQS